MESSCLNQRLLLRSCPRCWRELFDLGDLGRWQACEQIPQITPVPSGGRRALTLGCFDLILQAVITAFHYHGFSVVQESVQHGAGQGAVVVEDSGPVFIGLVGRRIRNYSGLAVIPVDRQEWSLFTAKDLAKIPGAVDGRNSTSRPYSWG